VSTRVVHPPVTLRSDTARSANQDIADERRRLCERPRQRVLWVDVARGFGIILVVYGHALRGLFAYPRSMPAWAHGQDRVIYAFHMPLFFVAAGLFLWRALERGRHKFLKSKALTVVYPYFLWSIIAGGIELAAGTHVNTPLSVHDLFAIPVAPIEQFWFLYSLFLIQVAAAAAYPRKWLVYVAAVAGAVASLTFGAGTIVLQTLLWLPYVAGGIAAAAALQRVSAASLAVKLTMFALSWIGFAMLMSMVAPSGLAGIILRISAGFSGSAGVIALSMSIGSGPIALLFARLGEASLAIYVMHTIFSAGARVLLKTRGFDLGPIPMLTVTTLVGIAFPFAIFRVAQQFGLGPWLGIGGKSAAARAR
jgi:fucose 4-O-acetylase-like acetyltransferase